jgi:hypothetical protein
MKKELELGADFRVPTEILTSAIGILGVRGSGKTTTAGVVVEEAIVAGVPAVIMDPTGAWFGLKSSADGKSAGLPVYVFGGEHADVPLEPDSGKIVAQFVIDKRVPVVLDVSLMRKNERTRFAADFFEEVYHRNRDPLLVVIDEAAQFVPQTYRGEKNPILSRCLGAVDDIVALGRRRGLGCILIGQRAARINKDVLTQCHTIVAMQLTSPQDRKALNEWVEEQHGSDEQAKEFLRSLTTLKVGEGFVWSPALLGVFQRVRFRNRQTFDSSATPKIGHKAIAPQVFAKVDLNALTSEIAAARERADADDPKKLWAKIRELEEQLAQRPDMDPTVERVEIPLFSDEERARLHNDLAAIGGLWERVRDEADTVVPRIAEVLQRVDAFDERGVRKTHEPATMPERSHAAKPPVAELRKSATARSAPATSSLPKAERALLTAIAQTKNGCERDQLSILSGYSVKSSSFHNAISALRSQGYAEQGWPLRITPDGLKALGDFAPLPTGRDLHHYWIRRLGKAPGTMLRILIDAHPGRLTKPELSDLSGYSITSSSFHNAVSELRTLQLIEGRGDLRASDALFDRVPTPRT